MGRAILDEILGFGYDGVRVDIPDDHAQATDVMRELKPTNMTGLFPIFLIAGGEMLRSTGRPFTPPELVAHVEDCCVKLRDLGYFNVAPEVQPAIEIGNEPDLAHDQWKDHPKLLAQTFNICFDLIRTYSAHCPVLSPSVSNLNQRGFTYLERMLTVPLHREAAIAFHRYPHDGDPQKPHEGFGDRHQETSKLVQMAAGRDLWLTETGLTEGPHDGKFHSEEFVAETYDSEARFWQAMPSLRAMTWYNINDGPSVEQIDHYGVRRLDGSWKPVARQVRPTKEALT
jgi:hypothetical protein